MAIDLAGRPIAITGASSGIGAATAVACARAGMPVALGARRVDKLEAIAERCREAGAKATVFELNVDDAGACLAFLDHTERELGGMYAVFANAGYAYELPAHDTPMDKLRAVWETNYFGTVNTVIPAANRFKERGAGHVIITSSCLSRMPVPYFSAYSGTKAAQSHLARAMRWELRRAGVHVTAVHPIGTKTEFFDQVAERSGGSSLDHTSEAFMQTPSFVAKHIVRALRRPKSEVWTGWSGRLVRLGMSICSALPGVENAAMGKMARRYHEMIAGREA